LPVRAAVITVSTSKSHGNGQDVSGPKLRELLERAGCDVVAVEVIPDERALIAGRLRYYADDEGCALIATTGGTGLSPDDVTPEATRDVIDREAPGIGEAMRLASRDHVPDHWFLSRGVAGTRKRTLIVNFPGNPNAIEQAGAAITGSLEHALGLLAGRGRHG
jgi:molybdopterin adenylyltransferase